MRRAPLAAKYRANSSPSPCMYASHELICLREYMYSFVYFCVYIYIYIHTHICVHIYFIYICTYVHKHRDLGGFTIERHNRDLVRAHKLMIAIGVHKP